MAKGLIENSNNNFAAEICKLFKIQLLLKKMFMHVFITTILSTKRLLDKSSNVFRYCQDKYILKL